MITISDPQVTPFNNAYNVAVTITNTDDNGVIIGTKSIGVVVQKTDNPVDVLQPFIDDAVAQLQQEGDELTAFKAPLVGYKDTMNSSIATKIMAGKVGV